MENYKEDKTQSLRTIFFLVLFFILVLSSSHNQGKHTSSTGFAKQSEMVSEAASAYHNAIISKAIVCLPDLQKCVLRNTSLNPFSIKNIISDYNRKSAQIYILNQKTSLSIEPVFTFSLYFHLYSNKDDDLPVLS